MQLGVTQKALQVPSCFSFSLYAQCFLYNLPKVFITKVLRSVTKEACDEDLTHSLDTPKSIFLNCFSSCYSGRLWLRTRIIHGSQNSQHSRKQNKWPDTRKQVSQLVCSKWEKIQGSKQKEIELISKKN